MAMSSERPMGDGMTRLVHVLGTSAEACARGAAIVERAASRCRRRVLFDKRDFSRWRA